MGLTAGWAAVLWRSSVHTFSVCSELSGPAGAQPRATCWLAGTGTDREHVCALTHMERDLRVQWVENSSATTGKHSMEILQYFSVLRHSLYLLNSLQKSFELKYQPDNLGRKWVYYNNCSNMLKQQYGIGIYPSAFIFKMHICSVIYQHWEMVLKVIQCIDKSAKGSYSSLLPQSSIVCSVVMTSCYSLYRTIKISLNSIFYGIQATIRCFFNKQVKDTGLNTKVQVQVKVQVF